MENNSKNNLLISSSPHIFSNLSVQKIMWNVAIALLPAVLVSLWLFRIKALMLIIVCVLTSIIAEVLFLKLRKKTISISDGSAVVTGLLLAMVLPPSIPLSLAALGAVVSIVIGKQVYGGIGQNIFNPALVGRAFLMAAFPAMMTKWINPFSLDAVTTATPLGLFKFSHTFVSLKELFIGTVPGSLGETSVLALVIGGIYLFSKGYADWRPSVAIFVGITLFSSILYIIDSGFGSPLFHLLSGGVVLGSLFMATDPVTSPVTSKGKWIFGIGIGIIIMVIRIWGGLPEGVMYSILLMNAFTPSINKICRPKRFGT